MQQRVVVCTLLLFQFLYIPQQYNIYHHLKVYFIPPPQTRNGHTKKGSGSLIRLLGGTTAKWLQIGAALTFLSNTPSLISGLGLMYSGTLKVALRYPAMVSSLYPHGTRVGLICRTYVN